MGGDMAGFCPECGERFDAEGRCPNGHDFSAAETAVDIATMPRPGHARRLGGAFIEYSTIIMLDLIGAILSPFTAFVSGSLTGILVIAYLTLIKDRPRNALSLGRRISRTRVVDQRTGEPITGQRAVLRNSYYAVLWLLSVFPEPIGVFFLLVLAPVIMIDAILIVAHPQGRRLGDFLAKTQVVPVTIVGD